MKNLISGAALVLLAAACGGGGKPQLLDAAVDSQFACNPVAKTGCKTGEKCTWIVDIDGTMTTNEVGHIGCVAVGATPTPEGQACADAVAATNGGADTCESGTLCISRKCKPICDPQTAGAAAGACKTNFACTTYAGVFDTGGPSVAGVCEPTCDPLTQRFNVGTTGTEACGSGDPTKPNASCVFGPDAATWVCAPSGSILYGKTDRKPPLTDPGSGRPYPNGCAPGFVPFYFEDASTAMKVLCSGLCAPMKVDSAIAAMTGHTKDNQGDITVAAKLPLEAASKAGNAVCVPTKKGADGLTAPHGEDCRFSWFPLSSGDPAKAMPTPYNNSLGFCFAYEAFHVVGPDKLPLKSCADLPPTAPDTDPFGSADDNGCYPLTTAAARKSSRNMLRAFRFGNEGGTLMRHILDE
jgi:hypothetical protein